MKNFLLTILGIVITGIVFLICLCFCYLGSKSDAYWEKVKEELEKHK